MHHKTTIEPFRIKVVEQIRLTAESGAPAVLQEAQYNPFLLHSDEGDYRPADGQRHLCHERQPVERHDARR